MQFKIDATYSEPINASIVTTSDASDPTASTSADADSPSGLDVNIGSLDV